VKLLVDSLLKSRCARYCAKTPANPGISAPNATY
jgi:hypothetical protein